MTKVSVFGQQSTKQPKELKKIEFAKALNSNAEWELPCSPSEWENIMLLEKSYTFDALDLIIAWDDDRDITVYLGHWNDGVI